MTFALLSADIPFKKINNPIFKQCLEKYTKQAVPDESTLRKNYLPKCYQNDLQKLREKVGKNFVYITVDETIDARGLQIANVLIGVLESGRPGQPFLLASKQLEKTNSNTICRFVNSSLKILDQDPGFDDRVLLLITDAATYMVKAGKTLKAFYQNLIHLTCVAHGLNRIAEKVRELFPNVNTLICNGKNLFKSAC